jgi:small GTP-binding protein
LASERLAKQLEEESAERELNPPGGHDEAASLELARLLDNEEREQALRRRRLLQTRLSLSAGENFSPTGDVPRVGSEEYKRRLKSATSKTETLTRGGAAPPPNITPPPNCLSRKIVVVGDSGVGKTALLLRFVSDTYYDVGVSGTIGGTYLAKCIDCQGTLLNLKIWDTAGQERYRSIVQMYYRGAVAAVLCCNASDAASFHHLKDWVDQVRLVCGPSVLLEIALTKSDVECEHAVSAEEVEAFARSLNASVTETSAKTRQGVDNLFQLLGRRIINEVTTPPEDNQTVSLPPPGFASSACAC